MRILTLAVVLILVSACEGPEGPEGLTGPQGEPGPPGAANVEAFTFTLNQSGFSQGDRTETFLRNRSEITSEILEGGVVLAYTDLGSDGDVWLAMPVVVPVSSSTVVLTFGYEVGRFMVAIMKSTSEALASAFNGYQVRVVLIPPSAGKAQIDYSDYEAVARHYGL